MSIRYRLTGRLESGELAELYEGLKDERDKVLVKLFHPRTSDQRYARIIGDAQVRLAPVEDLALLRVLDLGMVKGRLAIVREYVDGYTLGQALQRLLTREVLLPPAVALFVVIQLLDAVQKAHEVQVLHGAITPGNIVLGRDGRVAVADFGALAALFGVNELRAFAAKGRGAYRAPEVTASQGQATTSSDIYSLGAIAYELLTLREAVRATKAVSTRHQPLPPPSRLDRRINSRLDPVIMRALEQAPQRRFKTCAEFSSALRSVLSATGGMPGKADLSKVVADLFPNEVQLQRSGQVPFAEPFSLEEVTGVDVSSLSDRTAAVLVARPSFSGGAIPAIVEDEAAPGAQTVEGAPVFQDYEPPEAAAPLDAAGRPEVAPSFDEGTAPGAAGPLEHGWEAPPGQAPVKRPFLSASVPTGMTAALKRVRMVEDLSVPSDTVEIPRAEPKPKEPAPKQKKRAPTPPPEPEISQPLSAETHTRYPLVKEPGGKKRRMITEERSLYKEGLRQRRYLAVAVGVAVVGLFCFGLVIYRFAPKEAGSRAPKEETPSARTDAPTPHRRAEAEEAPPPPPVQPSDDRPVRIEAEPKDEPHRAPRRNIAYLTVKANERARVYVDGRRIPGHTPIVRYKVAAGTRRIAVQSVRTGERKEVKKRFVKGQKVSMYEFFDGRGR